MARSDFRIAERFPNALFESQMHYLPIVRSGLGGRPVKAILGTALAALCIPASARIAIQTSDQSLVAEGTPVTLTGTDFDEIETAYVVDPETARPIDFTLSGTSELTFTAPEFRLRKSPEYILLLGTDEATVGIPDDFQEWTAESGPAIPYASRPLVVRSGATAQEPLGAEAIYVETGGILKVSDNFPSLLFVFAEDGAVIDFTELAGYFVPAIYTSPETIILGDVPVSPHDEQPVTRPIPSLHPSFGIDPLEQGFEVPVSIIGPGTVRTEPPGPFFRDWEQVRFIAEPSAGANFVKWSGSSAETEATIELRIDPYQVQSLTAKFSEGWTLEANSLPNVVVTVSPSQSTYSTGQVVTVTAQADDGYDFHGWKGDVDAVSEILELTIQDHTVLYPVISRIGPGPAPQIDSVDRTIVPVDEVITVQGSRFSTVSGVSLYQDGESNPVQFEVVDDETLHVWWETRPHNHRRPLLIQADEGVAITLEGPPIEHFPGDQNSMDPISVEVMPGAVYEGENYARCLYVHTGARVNFSSLVLLSGELTVIAEDGAILDFRDPEVSLIPGAVIHCPNTIVLGDIPPGLTGESSSIPVPSVSVRWMPGLFGPGQPIELDIVGAGTVTTNPDREFFMDFEEVELTAHPLDGANFLGWAGDFSGDPRSPTLSLQMPFRQSPEITATFSEGWLLDLEEYPGVRLQISPEKPLYDDAEDVSVTAIPEDGYEFLGWWGDTADTLSPTISISMEGHRTLRPLVRLSDPAGIPEIQTITPEILAPDAVVEVAGASLEDTDRVFLLGNSRVWELEPGTAGPASVTTAIPEDLDKAGSGHLLIASPAGAVVGLPNTSNFFSGTGSLADDYSERPVVVEPGAVLTASPLQCPVIYVRGGGVLLVDETTMGQATIIAEEAAVLRFTPETENYPGALFLTPRTVVEGTIPTLFGFGPGQEGPVVLEHIEMAPGLPTLQRGYPIEVLVEGPGSIEMSPEGTLFAVGQSVEMTAVPDAGAYFIRWTGTIPSRSPTLSTWVSRPVVQTARFSAAPDYFTAWRPRYFSSEELGELAVSGLEADPDADGLTNAAEYAFGLDPRTANAEAAIHFVTDGSATGSEGSRTLLFRRPANALDVAYEVLLSSDLQSWSRPGQGPIGFSIEESTVTAVSPDLEEVRLRIVADSGVFPGVLFIRLTAEILGTL